MPNRSTDQIVADLLTATKESGAAGIGPTNLLTKANITHSRLRRLTASLVGAGLIIRVEANGRHVFAITSKGRQYLELHTQYHEMVESFGLEL